MADALSQRYRIEATLSIVLIILASLSLISPREIQAQAQLDQGRDWSHVNYDAFATNFNPQRTINKNNLDEIEIKWVFPIPEPSDPYLGGYSVGGQGEVSTTLIIDGVVYFATAAGRVYALDGKTGTVRWVHALQLDRDQDQAADLPIFFGSGMTHVHGITFFDGKLFIPAPPCDIYVIDAGGGDLVQRIPEMCSLGIKDGNAGKYKGPQSYGPSIYRMERVLIAAGGAVDETNRGGRGFFVGYDIDSGELLWRFFVTPKAGGDREWALRHADKGWIRGVRASSLPRESLINDWGVAGAMGSQAGPNRGQWTIDEESGIAYLGTTHAAPASNGTHRPGPNLFAASVIALKAKTGELVWWHQLVPHDLSDWDCNWNIVLGRLEIRGEMRKVIYKGCKDGSMNAFDAADGRMLWSKTPDTIKICEICRLLDPGRPESLRKPWANYPSAEPFFRNPTGRGGLTGDIAVAYNKVFYGTYNFWDYVKVTPVTRDRPSSEGATSVPPPEQRNSNTTIHALDAATGDEVWRYFLDGSGYRTGVIATGGMVIFSSVDGNLRALDAETGQEVWRKHFGVGLLTPPSVGADERGDMMILQAYGGQRTLSQQRVGGVIMAYHLSESSVQSQRSAEAPRMQGIGTIIMLVLLSSRESFLWNNWGAIISAVTLGFLTYPHHQLLGRWRLGQSPSSKPGSSG